MNLPEIILLNKIRNQLIDHNSKLSSFISNSRIKTIAKDYNKTLQKRLVDLGFNLFALISDVYYQENFHSDILKSFLDPLGNHHQGNKYLNLFLDLLISIGANINPLDFSNAAVVREQGRIDLLIKDDTTNKAIIIENKINGAIDMERQLPRYFQYVVVDKKYDCKAIIYLTLNQTRNPDTLNWSEEERNQIENRLFILNAYNETEKDLYNGWITESEQVTNHIDALLILRQYKSLIKKLGGNVMNKVIMERFYTEILKEDNFKTALSLKSMLNEMILYRVENIIDRFKHCPQPFQSVGNYRNSVAVFFTLHYKEANLSIDIGVYDEEYKFQFFDRNYNGTGENIALLMLKDMGYSNGFNQTELRLTKIFKFPNQESELFNYIYDFNKQLSFTIDKLITKEFKENWTDV